MMDERGADFLGMRLTVVLVAAALLLAFAAAYVDAFADRASRERARQEASRIAGLARAEYAAGGPDSGTSIQVAIPRCVKRLAFDGSAYTIEFEDGSMETRPAGCPFIAAALYPGTYRLDIAVIDNGTHAIRLGAAA